MSIQGRSKIDAMGNGSTILRVTVISIFEDEIQTKLSLEGHTSAVAAISAAESCPANVLLAVAIVTDIWDEVIDTIGLPTTWMRSTLIHIWRR
jgi:hypothetical protein